MPTVHIEYFGVEGSGRTVTEAKKDAGRKIEQSLAGDYTPIIVQWRGHAVLIWREPSGYFHKTIADGDGKIRPDHSLASFGTSGSDRDGAIERASMHVAQQGWVVEDGLDIPDIIKGRRQLHGEFRSWAIFQLRYRAASKAGLNSNDCHLYAGHAPMSQEQWDRLAKVADPFLSKFGLTTETR